MHAGQGKQGITQDEPLECDAWVKLLYVKYYTSSGPPPDSVTTLTPALD